MKQKMLWIMITGMVIGSTVFAQDQPQAQKNLMQFVGKWKSTDIQMVIGGETYGGVYTFDCSAVNMNTGVLAHEKLVSEQLGTMMAENLLGYDPNLQLLHLYTIDNFGTAHDHFGEWIDSKHMFLQYQGVLEGKVYLEQLDIVFNDPNTMVLNMTAMLNGEIFQQASGTFTK
ncbi:MAG: hypothetical protein ACWGNV_12695 [Bacteroidales bacterium]